MKMCTKTITIFNARYDKERDCSTYVPTVIKGVSVVGDVKSSVDQKGLNSANVHTIRIPIESFPKGYVDARTYTRMDDVSNVFTVNEGDIIIVGEPEVMYENTPASLKKEHGCITVMGVSDNLIASHARHLKITGC